MSFGEKFEDALMTVAEVVGDNKYLMAIKDAFTSFMPFIIIGSMGTLLKVLISSTSTGLAIWIPQLAALEPAFTAINFCTMSFMTLPVIFLIAQNLAKAKNGPEQASGVVSVAAYISMCATTITVDGLEAPIAGMLNTTFGAQGLFVGMATALVFTSLFCRLTTIDAIKIKMPPSVPAGIAGSFNIMIPVFITLVISSLFGIFFRMATGQYVGDFIYAIMQAPLEALFNTPFGIIGLILVSQLFWVLGIHGGLIVPPVRNPMFAAAIAAKMEELDLFDSIQRMDYDEAVKAGLITLMGAETDEKFLANVMGQVNDKAAVEKVADTFKMVYTPFHGTGYKLIPEALKRLGMKHVICVPEQMVIDGNFPTVVSPNPENPEGFYLAVDLAKKNNADFILGSDPDADRVGIMVRTKDDDFVVISGNQTGVLLLDYLIGAKRRTGKMPEKPVALKTIVTTEMARKVAEVNGLQCYDTFTGFKFLAEKKDKLENSGEGKVIFSYEESYGYMLGDYVRDKDAVSASVELSEMAAWYASQGMTLYDALQALFEKYGYYGEKTMNLVMPGLDGLKKMADLMANLRQNPPTEIAGVAVKQQKDYQDGSVVNVADGSKETMELSGSNVLRYEMADGTSLIVRPSGTEPKVKVYILANGTTKAECDELAEKALACSTAAEVKELLEAAAR